MSDLHFDRALRAAARRGRPEGVCPDAAALAAYVDGSLSPAEHASLETHVASCPSCMEHLGLLAAVDVPETTEELSDAWSFERLFGHWRWLVPVATAVLVATVWVRLSAPRASLPAPSGTPVASPATAGDATADKPAQMKQLEDDARARNDAASTLEVSRQKKADGARLQAAQTDALTRKERDQQAANERENFAVSAASPPPAPPSSAPQKAAAEEAKPIPGTPAEARAAADTAARVAAKDEKQPGVAESVAVTQAPVLAGGSARAMRKTLAAPPFELTAPGVRLRVVNGRFERSTDGATWTTERYGVTTRVLTGECPSADVCWLAGDGGQVFVRAGGAAWSDRPIPDIQITVTALRATSVDAATATLADGRRFSTTDGGRTWTPVQ